MASSLGAYGAPGEDAGFSVQVGASAGGFGPPADTLPMPGAVREPRLPGQATSDQANLPKTDAGFGFFRKGRMLWIVVAVLAVMVLSLFFRKR